MASRILIVEDEIFLLRIYEQEFANHGYRVETARNGEEGMVKIARRKPDLVLLDLILPRMTGFEVLENIQKDDSLRDIKVVILSNLSHKDDIAKGKRLGARDYIVKTQNRTADVIKRIRDII